MSGRKGPCQAASDEEMVKNASFLPKPVCCPKLVLQQGQSHFANLVSIALEISERARRLRQICGGSSRAVAGRKQCCGKVSLGIQMVPGTFSFEYSSRSLGVHAWGGNLEVYCDRHVIERTVACESGQLSQIA